MRFRVQFLNKESIALQALKASARMRLQMAAVPVPQKTDGVESF